MKQLKFSILAALLAIALALGAIGQGQAQQDEDTVKISGVLTIVWGDTQTLEGVPPRITLTDEAGNRTPVEIPAEMAAPFGGILNLNARRITIEGRWTEGVHAQSGETVLLAEGVVLDDDDQVGALGVNANALTGSQPWVNVLCRYKNDPAQPKAKSYFDGLFGNTFPGLNHYWRELSYNVINIDGTVTYGWYELPYDRAYYLNKGSGMLDSLAKDCTALADASVYYPNYVGINLMFNDELDGYAWGGTHYITLDGVTRIWRMTWEPPWGYTHHHTLAHEMGHGWGWPHSSGPYSNPYDSQWDVMSSWPPGSHSHETYGALGIHTITYHKKLSGWIPAERIYTASVGSGRTLTLERLSEIPAAPGTYLMAIIPIQGSSTLFYTVETRRRKDSTYLNEYEDGLPGQAVIIHKVDTSRADRDAQVVDASNNGDPNDAGAMWLPGETFTDSANKISIEVLSTTTNGYSIRVVNGQLGNDDYSGAASISNVPYTLSQDTGLATSSADDPTLSCIGSQGSNSIWFRYKPTVSGMLTVNTNGSAYDTAIAVLTGAPGSFTIHGCDDNGGANGASSLSLFVTGGTTYYIEVVGKNASGSLTFYLNHTPCYTLAVGVLPAGSGQVNVSLVPNCNGVYYSKGTSLQLFPAASPGFSFDKWSGSASGTANPLNLTINTNLTVYANFLPNAPVLLAPANGETIDSLFPTFDWGDYPTATSHRLQVSVYSNLSSPVFNSTTTDTHKTLATALKTNTRYYWRVQSLVNGVWSKWSDVQTFTTPLPPLAPKLLIPTSGAKVVGWQPSFDWADSLLPVPATGYQIQVAQSTKFDNTIWDEHTLDSDFDAPAALDFNSRYYWRVRAHNDLNHFGLWSAARVFYTLPQTPALLQPDEGSHENSLRPFFDWEDAANGARSYTIQVGKDPAFASLALSATVKTSHYQATRDLPRLSTLYWRIRPVGSYGTGGWSPARTFSTPNPPHTPKLLFPAAGKVLPIYSPALDWSDPPADLGTLSETQGYHLQIASDKLFSNIALDENHLSGSAFADYADLPAGKYFWRVRAYNAEMAYSNWSSVFNFTTPATVKGMVVDALTGEPLGGAVVSVDGTLVSVTTEADGSFTLTRAPLGSRKLIVRHDGYVPLARSLSVQAGKEYNLEYAILPSSPASAYRFVLTWDQSGPVDLDLHLWLPPITPSHIHRNNPGGLGIFPESFLHRDDRDGYGPETIQVDRLQPGGKYILAVYRKSDDGNWKSAKAMIQVYKGNTLIGTYGAPLSTSSYRWWRLLALDGTTGVITCYNSLSASSGASYDPSGGSIDVKP